MEAFGWKEFLLKVENKTLIYRIHTEFSCEK